jgi:hypothetical protein
LRVHLHLSLPCTAMMAASEFASYLQERHAEISTPDPFSVSAIAPLPLLSIDRRLYSRSNWIGLNPVAQADRIQARASETPRGSSLDVTITSLRFYFFPAIWLFTATVAAREGAPVAAWVFMVVLLSVYCALEGWLLFRGIRQEFLKYLRGRPLTIVGGGRERR